MGTQERPTGAAVDGVHDDPDDPASDDALGSGRSNGLTQDQRSALSSKRLLEAAGDLIVENGYSTLTLSQVGARAGYSRGLASMRFGTKEKLLEALLDRITKRWKHRHVQPRTVDAPAIDSILVLVDEIRVQIRRDPRSVRVLYTLMFEALAGNEFLRQHFIAWNRARRQDVVDLLRRGIADRSVRPDVDVHVEAANIVASLRGIAYQWVLDPDGFDPVAPLGLLSSTVATRLAPPSCP